MNRRNLIRAIGSTAAVTTTAVTAGCLDDASDVVSSAAGQSNVPEYTLLRTESGQKFTTIEDEELFIEEGDEGDDELVFEVILDVVEEHEDLHSDCIGFEFAYTAFDEDGVVLDEQDSSSSAFVSRNTLSLGNNHRKTLTFEFDDEEIEEIEELEIRLAIPADTFC